MKGIAASHQGHIRSRGSVSVIIKQFQPKKRSDFWLVGEKPKCAPLGSLQRCASRPSHVFRAFPVVELYARRVSL